MDGWKNASSAKALAFVEDSERQYIRELADCLPELTKLDKRKIALNAPADASFIPRDAFL